MRFSLCSVWTWKSHKWFLYHWRWCSKPCRAAATLSYSLLCTLFESGSVTQASRWWQSLQEAWVPSLWILLLKQFVTKAWSCAETRRPYVSLLRSKQYNHSLMSNSQSSVSGLCLLLWRSFGLWWSFPCGRRASEQCFLCCSIKVVSAFSSLCTTSSWDVEPTTSAWGWWDPEGSSFCLVFLTSSWSLLCVQSTILALCLMTGTAPVLMAWKVDFPSKWDFRNFFTRWKYGLVIIYFIVLL